MALTTEQMQKITVEVVTGKPPTIKGDEANKFRSAVEKDVKEMRAKGITPDIPKEWEADV